ncbi:hypothetical protein B0H13DRAFT_2033085 [Mycena leptocephala]|nr:hypothetical protein B0H13DRAFT_2033085 [Mycena leptocephala]
MLALWLTADGLPLAGYPDIVYSSEQLLHGVPDDLLKMYEDVPHPKFFLVVSGGNGAVMRTHGLIREAIGNRINIDPTDFTLGTPPTAANGRAPRSGSPPTSLTTSRRRSSRPHSILHQHYSLPPPYDMPIIGFVGGADRARDLIRTAAWEHFLASISVQGIVLIVNDTNTVAWRLFVEPPTAVREHWSHLRRLFGKLKIMTALHGTARLQRAFRCHICPAIDHPTALCPLPGLPGWLGATPPLLPASRWQLPLSPGQGRNQGNSDGNPRRDGKGKKGGAYKGKGKRRERDDYF